MNRSTRPIFISVIALLALSACAGQQKLQAVSGSRSDATVELAFDWFDWWGTTPDYDRAQADALATDRCSRWGYADAEPFGAAKKTCGGASNSTCKLTVIYQCLDD